jgi:AbrB family looped-hinge helix DNA binding protein
MKRMTQQICKTRVGKKYRMVLPKELREAYSLNEGDEVHIVVHEKGVSMHFHKVPEDPLQDLVELSKSVSIGLSAKQLKSKADEERLKPI